MNKWQHIFMGEYAAREKILAGLTLGQVTHVPSKESHSIYEELWHIVQWQHIMVFRDEELYEAYRKGKFIPRIRHQQSKNGVSWLGSFLRGLGKLSSGQVHQKNWQWKLIQGLRWQITSWV
jgi:hypothetical protein